MFLLYYGHINFDVLKVLKMSPHFLILGRPLISYSVLSRSVILNYLNEFNYQGGVCFSPLNQNNYILQRVIK